MRALVAFAIIVAVLLAVSLWLTDGQFTYILDDTYIHMALAKHLVEDGVWGVTAYEPSTSSSSILWPLILAGAMVIAGDNISIPFVVNLLLAVGMILWLPRPLAALGLDLSQRRRTALIAVAVSAVAILVFLGMEHTLHVWATLMFATVAARALGDDRPTFRRGWPLLLLGPLAVGARYESLAMVAVVCVLLALRNGIRTMFGWRLLLPAAVGVAALVPVVVFGVVMKSMDLPMIPYSVQLKSWSPTIDLHGAWLYFGPRLLGNVIMSPHLALLLACSLVTLRYQYRKSATLWAPPVLMNLLFSVMCLVHLEFALTGPSPRYFAYLLGLGVMALAIADGPLWRVGLVRIDQPDPRAGRSAIVLAWSTVVLTTMLTILPHAAVGLRSRSIYQQQIQMARFFDAYYAGQAVALNDIGTTAYGADVRMVDIWGLASKEVAELRLAETYTVADIDRITRRHDVQVAIVYDSWFKSGDEDLVPTDWRLVGRWTIPTNVGCAHDTVSIYSVTPSATADLIDNLKDFADKLPAAVIQTGLYTDDTSAP